MKPSTFLRISRGATLLAALLLGAAPAALLAQDPPRSGNNAAGTRINLASPSSLAANNDPKAPLFSAFGETLTGEQFAQAYQDLPEINRQFIGGQVGDPLSLPPEQLRQLVESYVAYQQAVREVDAAGETPELSPEMQGQVARLREQILAQAWYQENIAPRIGEVTAEEIQAYYDENKDTYKLEPQLQFRHIFLPTYETVTVKEGDSLESLAERIAGDAAAADRILDERTKKPRVEMTHDEAGNELPPRALVAGERLMVPMGPEGREKVGQQLEEITTRLEKGEDFQVVAAETSQTDNPGRLVVLNPEQNRPILPELQEAFFTLEDGKYSEPLETKHGYQIVQRVAYRPESTRPLEEVRPTIERMLTQQNRNKAMEEVFGELWKNAEEPAVNEDVLQRAFDAAALEEVILEVDGQRYTADAFTRDFSATLTAESSLEERRAALSKLGMVRRKLFEQAMAKSNLAETPEVRAQLADAERQMGIAQYLNSQVQQGQQAPTDEELQERYETRKEAFSSPQTVNLLQITIDPQLPEGMDEAQRQKLLETEQAKLKEELATVKTEDEFKALAGRISQDEFARFSGQIGRKGMDYLSGLGQRLYDEGTEGQLFGPLEQDGKIRAFYLISKHEATTPTLEQARETLTNELQGERAAAQQQELLKGLLEKAKFEYLADSGASAEAEATPAE